MSRGRLVLIVAAAALAAAGVGAAGARDSHEPALAKSCRAGSVRGVIGGKRVCLKAGQRCLRRLDAQYHRFGFHCHSGRLTRRSGPTRPKGAPPRLKVLKRSSLDGPGYVLIAPKNGSTAGGPEIVDDHGRPIWFHPNSKGDEATDFRVQRFRGQPVLTWWEGQGLAGSGAGVDYVADGSYRVIATVHAGHGLDADGHEFLLTPQGTALMTIYHDVPYDLSPVGGPADGVAVDGIVQEIDVASGRVLFEWHSLDHVGIRESYLPVESPYDYFHINAVNLDNDGNLLISGRHTWTVYKVDRHSGQVLWRLGGRRSDFSLGPGVAFAWQHNPLPAGENTIRLFDNETNGSNSVSPPSRVIWIHLDAGNATATLEKAITHSPGLMVQSQGNAQALENGDTFVGWGQLGRVSEFDPQGNLLFDAYLPGRYDTYRAYRAAWTGQPQTRPVATAWTNADGSTTVHAIWSGATEVAAWRILAGSKPSSLVPTRTARWNGLDTRIKIRGLPLEVEVVALNAQGSVIEMSKPVRVG
ncbi:MAG TPA: arylsulfotransferase family protein [Gaiellaceae bacterium]|nr:arylsulfotransferase family protein [Gaiellaceae bacterium]